MSIQFAPDDPPSIVQPIFPAEARLETVESTQGSDKNGLVWVYRFASGAAPVAIAIADSGALQERVKLLQEELGAILGEQAGRTLFVLTVVTVLALPINLTAGLFGMNVGGVPFAEHRQGFAVVVGGLAVLTLAAAYLALGRRRD